MQKKKKGRGTSSGLPKAARGKVAVPKVSPLNYRYFVPKKEIEEWDKGGGSVRSSVRGKVPAQRSQRSLPSRSYFTPTKPFLSLTDHDVLAWFERQDADWRGRIEGYAALADMNPIDYVRKMAAPPCVCGYDGNPREFHVTTQPVRHGPVQCVVLPDYEDDDDDIPF